MNNTQTKWIVTGCNGYLGSEICLFLHSAGKYVIGVARSNRDTKSLTDAGIKCITYDDLAETLGKSDIFIHCAGKTGFVGTWEEYEKINVQWTKDLFNLCSQHNIECFIFISSVAAMGYKNREHAVLTEKSEPLLHAEEYYGRSKLLAEQSLEELSKSSRIRTFMLRPGLVYGNRPALTNHKRFRRGSIVDPEARIPFTHVNNFTEALLRIVSFATTEGVYLVVDDEQPTQRELIALKKKLGLIKYEPWTIGVKAFFLKQEIKNLLKKFRFKKNMKSPPTDLLIIFHTRKLIYDCRKLKGETGWEPSISLEEGWRQISNNC